MFKKILIANRGEIACRVAATAKRMSIRTVAVYSDADANAKHVAACDEAVHIGGSAPKDSYLRWERDEPMALTALRKRQLEESTIAGAAYQSRLAELNWYQGGEYVITDEAGIPVHPEWYSDEFGRLLRRAGLRRITLHDSRHTTLTLMEHAGVPISIISKWAGHYDSAFTQKTYVHASDDDLQRGQAALAKIHKIA